jgi:hypothetical protein
MVDGTKIGIAVCVMAQMLIGYRDDSIEGGQVFLVTLTN